MKTTGRLIWAVVFLTGCVSSTKPIATPAAAPRCAPTNAVSDRSVLAKVKQADFYVEEVNHPEDPTCTQEEIPLTNSTTKQFFERARVVTMGEIHDHYDWVECKLEGTAQLDGLGCSWWVQGTGIGMIRCATGKETLVACDDECNHLFVECDCKPLPRKKPHATAPERTDEDKSAQ